MRAIDADELMELLTTAIRNMEGVAKFIGAEDDPEIRMEIKAYTEIANGVKDMPTIEPERKTGKWEIYVISPFDGEGCRCSECKYEGAPYWNFCPNCGTYNEEVNDGDI